MNYLHATLKANGKPICFNVDQIVAVHDFPGSGNGTTIYAISPDCEFVVSEDYDTINRRLPTPE